MNLVLSFGKNVGKVLYWLFVVFAGVLAFNLIMLPFTLIYQKIQKKKLEKSLKENQEEDVSVEAVA